MLEDILRKLNDLISIGEVVNDDEDLLWFHKSDTEDFDSNEKAFKIAKSELRDYRISNALIKNKFCCFYISPN